MRKILLVAAAGVVLAANGWSLFQAARNHGATSGGSLELTENELPLTLTGPESTAMVLRLDWRSQSEHHGETGQPPWLNTNKLAELGFDLTLPLESPNARNHYNSMPGRLVYLVLEYGGDGLPNTGVEARVRTRLVVVDAGLDPGRLRERYPQAQRHAICRGSVGLSFREYDPKDGRPLEAPFIQGRVETLRPGQVFVPAPKNQVLAQFRSGDSEDPDGHRPVKPRYAVRVVWGSNYEPWAQDLRLLPAEQGNGP